MKGKERCGAKQTARTLLGVTVSFVAYYTFFAPYLTGMYLRPVSTNVIEREGIIWFNA